MIVFYKDGSWKLASDLVSRKFLIDDKNVIGVGKFSWFMQSHMICTTYLYRKENRFHRFHGALVEICRNTVTLRSYSCPGNGRELTDYWLRTWFADFTSP